MFVDIFFLIIGSGLISIHWSILGLRVGLKIYGHCWKKFELILCWMLKDLQLEIPRRTPWGKADFKMLVSSIFTCFVETQFHKIFNPGQKFMASAETKFMVAAGTLWLLIKEKPQVLETQIFAGLKLCLSWVHSKNFHTCSFIVFELLKFENCLIYPGIGIIPAEARNSM